METKKTWVTEIGTVLLGVGGAIQAFMSQVDMSNWQFYSQLSDIATGCIAIGGALIGYRISKKAGKNEKA